MLTDGPSRLDEIDHIVVLMLENRSFDHMLGYLALDPTYPHRIDGLTTAMSNTFEGVTYPVFPLAQTRMAPFENPPHGGDAVSEQVAHGNSGFAASYIKTQRKHGRDVSAPSDCVVMGYHDGDQLFAFDHLARQFTVCDKWFSSVLGATMPNRLYSVAGESGGKRSNRKIRRKVGEEIREFDFPIYDFPSFVRHLDHGDISWRWYHPYLAIPPTLKLFDPAYRVGDEERFSRFKNFARDARNGDLPSVTWIDPSFFDKWWMNQTDDHPPADVRIGQALVAHVANALMESPCWEKSALVIVYDEHGGFFDHVSPPPAPDAHQDTANFGVRVPALVVSPFAPPGVSSVQFDHTSIMRTILDRFCPEVPQEAMGTRAALANSLASVLVATDPVDASPVPTERFRGLRLLDDSFEDDTVDPALEHLIATSSSGVELGERLAQALADEALRATATPTIVGDGVAEGRELDDLQRGMLAAAAEVFIATRRAVSGRTGPTRRW